MGLFGGNRYPQGHPVPVKGGIGFRTILLVIAIIFGLYFLNLAFLWVKAPIIGEGFVRTFNIITGIFFIFLGIMTKIKPRY